MTLQNEVDILSQLDHPNVVKLYEIYDESASLNLVLELMTGGEVIQELIIKYSFLIVLWKRNITLKKKLLKPLNL